MTQRERRAAEVAAGNCSQCYRPREDAGASMCDECKRQHRERQRGVPKAEALYLTKRRKLKVDKLLAYLKRERGMK